MDDQPDCYVAGSLASMLRCCRLGGIAPLKFVKSGAGWRVSLSRGWSYYGYFIIAIIIVITIGVLITDFKLGKESVYVNTRTNLFCAVAIVNILVSLLISATGVFGAPSLMVSLIACVNRVQKISCELNISHRPMYNERKNTYIFLLWVTMTFLSALLDYFKLLHESFFMNEIRRLTGAMYFFYYWCFWIMQLCQIRFIMVVLHVMYSLKGINVLLTNVLRELAEGKTLFLMIFFDGEFGQKKDRRENISKKKCFNRSTNKIADFGLQEVKSIPETIRRLASAYADICDVVRDVDDAHGPIVLMMLGCFLLHLICTPYFLITILYKDYSQYSTMDWINSQISIGSETYWCFYHAANLLMVVESCHLTHLEMETTSDLVSHLIHCTDSMHDPVAFQLDIFLKHIVLNKASYSAMQVTTVSRPLLVTIFGCVTTYLVILIQM